MSEHIGDDAELYALGVFDDADRRRIDGHLAACDACSRAVGEAERTSLALADLEWPASGTSAFESAKRARGPWSATFAKAAAAAALILLAVSAELGIENHRLAQSSSADDVALATLATSHFLHASFIPQRPGVAASKAMYARDGAWTFVIVDGSVEGWHVFGKIGAAEREVATLHARGRTSTAFSRAGRRFDALELQNTTGETVATVSLAYPKANP